MKYFIISDIHSNLEGLMACLRDFFNFNPSGRIKEKIALALESQEIFIPNEFPATKLEDKVICLGDIVGYGLCYL